jgi:hypothetical protein
MTRGVEIGTARERKRFGITLEYVSAGTSGLVRDVISNTE